MTIEMVKQLLLWCTIINAGFFALAFLMFALAHDWIYKIHSRWFRITLEQFSATMYTLMIFYKTCIIIFNFVPLVALHIVTR